MDFYQLSEARGAHQNLKLFFLTQINHTNFYTESNKNLIRFENHQNTVTFYVT